jgi:peptidoglycan/LPS O-acetylase OafA/YrhL
VNAGALTNPAGLPAAAQAPTADPVGARAPVAAPEPVWLNRGRVPGLDGLRAVSIALVFAEHIALAAGVHGDSLRHKIIGNIGVLGVDVFFAISGFLITLLLLREYRKTSTISLKGFYARRFLRLMPAAIVYLVTVAVIQWSGEIQMNTWNWIHAVTYTVNFDPNPAWEVGHLWSLSIEEHFYLCWPVAMFLLPKRRLPYALVGWLVAAPLARMAVVELMPHAFERFELWTFFRVDCIAAGCLLALLSQQEWFRRATQVRGGVRRVLLAASVAVMLAGFVASFKIGFYSDVLDQTVRAGCVAALIWLTINGAGGTWFRLLESRPLVVVGILSYSLYLWQQLFITHPQKVSLGLAHRLPFNVVFAVAAAVASYLLVERPFLSLKERFARHG